jgi:hypothetical protein
MAKKQVKKVNNKKLVGDERVVDLLERLGAVFLYTNTTLGQNEVAKVIGIDVHRVSELVKGIKKSK